MLNKIKINNFRNHQDQEFKFDQYNYITGNNGVGKTNILEAIYILSIGKSFRSPDQGLINYKSEFFRVEGEYVDNTVLFYFDASNKKLTINDIKKNISDIIGIHPVVLFEPEQLGLFYYQPMLRRSWMDQILSQVDEQYLINLIHYIKLIKNKNIVLKGSKNIDLIKAVNIQIIPLLDYLIAKRKFLIEELNIFIKNNQELLFDSKYSVEVNYKFSIEDISIENLNSKIDTDIKFGASQYGIHRDDLIITINGQKINQILSRGEMRLIVFLIKVFESKFILDQTKKNPLIILDDIFSELDVFKEDKLIKSLPSSSQIFISTTRLNHIVDANIINL